MEVIMKRILLAVAAIMAVQSPVFSMNFDSLDAQLRQARLGLVKAQVKFEKAQRYGGDPDTVAKLHKKNKDFDAVQRDYDAMLNANQVAVLDNSPALQAVIDAHKAVLDLIQADIDRREADIRRREDLLRQYRQAGEMELAKSVQTEIQVLIDKTQEMIAQRNESEAELMQFMAGGYNSKASPQEKRKGPDFSSQEGDSYSSGNETDVEGKDEMPVKQQKATFTHEQAASQLEKIMEKVNRGGTMTTGEANNLLQITDGDPGKIPGQNPEDAIKLVQDAVEKSDLPQGQKEQIIRSLSAYWNSIQQYLAQQSAALYNYFFGISR